MACKRKERKVWWTGVVYCLTNLVNGMRYVGKTTLEDYERRWDAHIKMSLKPRPKHYIHRAIRKYGVEKFSAEVVQHCRTAETLNKAERRWIKKLGSQTPHGYNMTRGGDGVAGRKPTKSELNKKSISLKLHWAIPANRAAHLAVLQSEECRALMSAGQRRKWAGMSAKEKIAFSKKMSSVVIERYKEPRAHEVQRQGQAKRFADPKKWAANAQAHRTTKFRALQSEKSKAKWLDPEYRRVWEFTNLSTEGRAKRSTAAKKWHADPEKHNRQNYASNHAPAACAKRSATLLAHYAKPKNRTKHQKSHRTPAFRAKKSENTKQFWGAMTPAERKAYWREIHPKGNGYRK